MVQAPSTQTHHKQRGEQFSWLLFERMIILKREREDSIPDERASWQQREGELLRLKVRAACM